MPEGEKGFTLIEILITLAIIGIVMLPVSMVFYWGYSNYYFENDDMNTVQRAREAMDAIMEDLRRNDSPSVNVIDGGNTLFINKDLVYTYSAKDKELLKNGISIFGGENRACVNYFKAAEIKPDGYDSNLIDITIKIKVGKSEEITLQNNYRKKTG